MNFYQFLVPRLDGDRIDETLPLYRDLVHRGVAGFIIFGGELESLREAIVQLQRESALPLLIASDLEQGLGQQVEGGTVSNRASAHSSVQGQICELGVCRGGSMVETCRAHGEP